MKNEKGFLVLEILIAGLILTASVAATMYLFRIGSEGLERANASNLLAARMPQAVNFIKNLDMNTKEGSEDLGEGILLSWKAELREKSLQEVRDEETGAVSKGMHELYLYQVDFSLADDRGLKREYKINVLRYKSLISASDTLL